MAVIFLFLKLEEKIFFSENVYLYVNFTLQISKYKFQRPQSAVGEKTAADLYEILIRYVDTSGFAPSL